MARHNAGRRQSHNFSQVPAPRVARSVFNRSFSHKTTFDAGFCIPVFTDEMLPGDTINVTPTLFARLATPLFPLLDNLYMDLHFFAVPIRLVWTNFQKFMGEQTDPGDSTDFLVPTVNVVAGESSLWDYMGINPFQANDVCAFYTRAYNLIWNEWYRDENLQDSVVVDKDDGPDTGTDYRYPLQRGKRKDYFSGSLPWAQKGDAVSLPLGTSAPVVGTGDLIPQWSITGDANIRQLRGQTGGSTNVQTNSPNFPASGTDLRWSDTKLETDLTAATAATINQIRQAVQIQKLYERDARGGTRYTELLRAHFGVVSPDARLQRPEYLGGLSFPIGIHSVPQTSSTDGTSPQGNLAAYGVGTGMGRAIVKSFTEHCVVLGIVSARADLSYQQGVPRMFSRSTRWDYFWPGLAHIGEQAVLNKEIYTDGSSADDDVWGYQERYGEYRYKENQLSGKMRSDATSSLDAWHLAQDFTARPALNDSFIKENPPVDRVIAVPSEPHFLLDCYFRYRHVRPMPVFGVPGLMDHF